MVIIIENYIPVKKGRMTQKGRKRKMYLPDQTSSLKTR